MSQESTTWRADEWRTMYFVALVRMQDHRHMLSCEMFTVSGRTPLTRDEAVARFDRMQADRWPDAEYGPVDSWRRGACNVSWCEVGPA